MNSSSLKGKYKKESGLWSSFPKFILVNLGIVTVLMVYFCPGCFFSWEGILSLYPDFIFSFAISLLLSYGGNLVEDFYESRISWIHHPVKRLLVTVFTYLTYSFVGSFVVILVILWLQGEFLLTEIPWRRIYGYTFLPMGIALVFMALFTTRSWLVEWRKSAIEAEQLRTEKLASQYQSLKDQLNPHFLFNSLNVLSNLVYEDPDKSAAFIQKLSKIYRYVLEVQREELVELGKELSFARNYLELQKIRFEENLQYSIQVSQESGFVLPPLSLQLLLENAIKHNIASQEDPLFIKILSQGNELWVSNSFNPKTSFTESSTGVGLENIRLRYQLLSDKRIEVNQSENEFIVRLPLLQAEL